MELFFETQQAGPLQTKQDPPNFLDIAFGNGEDYMTIAMAAKK